MAEHCTVLPEEHRRDFHFIRVVGPRFSLSFDPLREWLDDPTRPGLYCWGGHWLASAGNLSPRDCIEVAITDPDVALEFKLRWV